MTPLTLQILLRRGLPLAVLVAAATVLGYIGRISQWRGVWTETQSHIGTALIFAVPAAAAAGAWVGSASRRSGFQSLQEASSRSRVTVALRDHGETCLWTVLGYLIGSAPAVVMTLTTAHVGNPHLLPVLAQASCVAAMTVIGQRVGTHVPWYLGAPLCAVAAYVLLGFASFTADHALLALTPIDERWMTFHRTSWWVFALQCLMWTLLVAAMVLRSAGRKRTAVIGLWMTGICAAPLLYVTPMTREVDPLTVGVRCEERNTIAICLPHGKEELRDGLQAAVSRNAVLLAGLLEDQITYVDDETRGISKPGDASLDRTIDEQRTLGRTVILFSEAGDLSARTQIDDNQFFLNFATFVFVPSKLAPISPPGARKPLATTPNVLQRWYLRSVGVPTDGTGGYGAPALDTQMLDYGEHVGLLKDFDHWTTNQREVWFQAHRSAIRDGTLKWSDFDEESR